MNIVFNVVGTPSDKPLAPKTESNNQETDKQETDKQGSNPIIELNKLIGLSNVKKEISILTRW